MKVGLQIKNVGDTALTIHWGTHGGGNYQCRDTHLSFTATRDGVAVPANPKPLPDGFIISPHVAQPNTFLKRTVDLSEWLQFENPGDYLINAAYKVEIENPQKDGTPDLWAVTYHQQFTVRVSAVSGMGRLWQNGHQYRKTVAHPFVKTQWWPQGPQQEII